MWDDPRFMNAAANALFALACLLVLVWAGNLLVGSSGFALRVIQVRGDLGHVTRGAIVDALQGKVSGTFFTVDLDQLRATFEAMSWVRRAEVRRRWPDRLEVRIEEHVPIARWGRIEDGRLVNRQGEVFAGSVDDDLPQFAGPAGTEGELTRRYSQFRVLLAPISLEPRTLLLSQRFSWVLKLSNGLTVQLGRDGDKHPVRERLARFAEFYPQTLGRQPRRFDYVDLRYPNGFALRVPEIQHAEYPKRRKS